MKLSILSFLLALLPLAASADAVEINGIYYYLIPKGNAAEVTSNPNKYSGTVVIPETVTYNDVTYSVTNIGNDAFYGCNGLTSITIPNSVTSIGYSAFYKCSGLSSIVIPNSVTSIGGAAFSGCSGLTSISIGNSVTNIKKEAFQGCSRLTSVNISDMAAWCSIVFSDSYSNPLSKAKSLYLNGEKVTNLIIPNSVTSIKNYAFYGCSSLTSITIPNSVTSIGSDALAGCSSLTSITIPNSVTSIGSDALAGCSSLTNITIPNSVTSIANHAFDGCSGLTSITIPNSVTSIGSYAFFCSSSLTSITIPNSVTSIGSYAFTVCSSLTSITIPNSVTYIGKYAFSCCDQLTDVYCYAKKVPSTDATTFDDSYINYATLHVPESAIESYKAKAPWNGFQKIVSIEGGGQLFDMTVKVDNAFGKVTYGTTDITDGQLTFNVKEGSNVVLTLTPAAGFKVSKVMVNGEDKTTDVVNGQMTLSNITANMTVTVTFAAAGDCATVTVGSQGVVTFSAVSDVDFTSVSGVKAYIGSGFNRKTGVLTMTRVYDVPAGEGLLLKGASGTYQIPYKQSYSIYSNLLKGVSSETNLSATTGGYVNYVLGSGSSGTGFYRVPASGTTLAAGHAYLQIPAETATGSRALTISFDDENEATAISDVQRPDAESAVYDLQGRRVEQPRSGLYIRNGKKMIIK